MKLLLPFLVIFLIASCSGGEEEEEFELDEIELDEGKWIDLSYPFSNETLYWPNNPTGFDMDTISRGVTPGGFYYSSFAFCAPEHGGTHLDAPVHFAEGKQSVDQVSLVQLTGRAAVVDVSAKTADNRDYLVSVDDVQLWEKTNGPIPDSAILMIRTGFGQYYPDPLRYFGTDKKGDSAIAQLHFPGIDPQLAEWLVKNRKIKAVGIDTPSIDYGQSSDFRTHRILLAENIPAFENVAHMDQLPVKNSYVIALPMQIKNGSGAPLRIIAFVPD